MFNKVLLQEREKLRPELAASRAKRKRDKKLGNTGLEKLLFLNPKKQERKRLCVTECKGRALSGHADGLAHLHIGQHKQGL